MKTKRSAGSELAFVEDVAADYPRCPNDHLVGEYGVTREDFDADDRTSQ